MNNKLVSDSKTLTSLAKQHEELHPAALPQILTYVREDTLPEQMSLLEQIVDQMFANDRTPYNYLKPDELSNDQINFLADSILRVSDDRHEALVEFNNILGEDITLRVMAHNFDLSVDEYIWSIGWLEDLCQSDPESAWHYVVDLADYLVGDALDFFSASVLEVFVAANVNEWSDKIEERIQFSENFAKAILGVWVHQSEINPDVQTKLEEALNQKLNILYDTE